MSDPGGGGEFPARSGVDPAVPLLNLSAVQSRMDSLQRFLSEAVNSNTLIGKEQMQMVSSEISSAIHQIILNGAALLASTTATTPAPLLRPPPVAPKAELEEEEENERAMEEEAAEEVVEIDAVELLAEHVHLCEICGKGFKRDANLRMHMRAHGDRFKTPQALAKPPAAAVDDATSSSGGGAAARKFSCPYEGCNRNRKHKKFRPLKSVICVRNHFKRSHCPKMYACNRCNKKSFSVVADLKSHLKHCGESRWRCSCGTSFSRKDKLFGHMALFEGHMPAVVEDDDEEGKRREVGEEAGRGFLGGEEDDSMDGFFDGLLDGFGAAGGGEISSLQELLGSPGYGGGGGGYWGGGGGFYGGGL